MPGAVKVFPQQGLQTSFPASRFNDPRGGRINALERNILRYRAAEVALYLFYTEDVRSFLLKTIYQAGVPGPFFVYGSNPSSQFFTESDRLQAKLNLLVENAVKEGEINHEDAEKIRDHIAKNQNKKLKIAIKNAIRLEILNGDEAKELHSLIDYRNEIAHRIHDIFYDISRLSFVTAEFEFYPPKYKAKALDRLRALRSNLRERSSMKLAIMLSFDSLRFEAAEKTYGAELKRLERLIGKQIARERAAWDKLRPQLILAGSGLEGDFHPRHPANHRPARHVYGDDYEPETGHLTKRGVEICYRIFDLGRSPLAAAWLMGMTLRSAERRYVTWQKLGRKARQRLEILGDL